MGRKPWPVKLWERVGGDDCERNATLQVSQRLRTRVSVDSANSGSVQHYCRRTDKEDGSSDN